MYIIPTDTLHNSGPEISQGLAIQKIMAKKISEVDNNNSSSNLKNTHINTHHKNGVAKTQSHYSFWFEPSKKQKETS